VAQWLLIGFIHGVMNTDNMSVAGETIDYGPCAFMDPYHPATVYSSIDRNGRYAYGNQPDIAHWNLFRLAESLLPLLDPDVERGVGIAREVLDTYPARFETSFQDGLRQKLGLTEALEGDEALARGLLDCMAEGRADFTLTFRRLSDAAGAGPDADGAVRSLFGNPDAFDAWAAGWRRRLAHEGGPSPARRDAMRAVNPAFIPRNHRIQAVITAALTKSDFGPLDELMTVLSTPYADQPDRAQYAEPPLPQEVVHETFCGT